MESSLKEEEFSLRKALTRWTGISFLRKKYRLWKARGSAVADFGYGKFSRKESFSASLTVQRSSESATVGGSGCGFSCFDNILTNDELASMTTATATTNFLQASETISRERDGSVQDDCCALTCYQLDSDDVVQTFFEDDVNFCKEICKIPSSMYIFQRLLGVGSFSKVKLAVDIRTGEEVAIKMLEISESYEKSRLQRTLLCEVNILHKMKHPNIVKFKGISNIKDSICLVMSYVPGIELFQYVVEKRRLREEEAMQILKQVLFAVEYLHEEVGVAHRDLKLENVLIETISGRASKITLIDFGLAKVLRSFTNNDTANLLTTRCGSEEYAAPEVILGKPYDGRASDIWSIGVILYACLVGSLPFNPEPTRPSALAEKIVSANYQIPSGLVSLRASQLISWCLCKDPSKRPCASALLKHAWFNTLRTFSV